MGLFDWIKKKNDKDDSKDIGSRTTNIPRSMGSPSANPDAPSRNAAVMPRSQKAVTPRATPAPRQAPVASPFSTTKVTPVAPAPPSAEPPGASAESVIADTDISFSLGEFSDQIPEGLLAGDADNDQTITFNSRQIASEISRGKASLKLSEIASAHPELFSSPVSPDQNVDINFPLNRVIEQLGDFGSRSDQEAPDAPTKQFETPFLQGAIKDGAEVPAPDSSEEEDTAPPQSKPPEGPRTIPGPKLDDDSAKKPAASAAIPELKSPNEKKGRFAPGNQPDVRGGARRPPATVRASVGSGKIKLGTLSTAKTPDIANKGPRGPVTIRTSPSGPGKQMPGPNPPKAIPVGDDIKGLKKTPPPTAVPPKPSAAPQPAAAATSGADDGKKLDLSLVAIIEAMPGDYISGDADSIPKDTMVSLPQNLITSQLTRGKVTVEVGTFTKALPEEYHDLFADCDDDAEIQIPMQEIMAKLPPDALTSRSDQEVDEHTEEIPTPFSQKAKEDAKRLSAKDSKPPEAPQKPEQPEKQEPVTRTSGLKKLSTKLPQPPPPTITPAMPQKAAEKPESKSEKTPKPEPKKVAEIKPPSAPKATGSDAAPAPVAKTSGSQLMDAEEAKNTLQEIFMIEEDPDARLIARLTKDLPGVTSVLICTSDGLRLAGELGDGINVDALAALVPSFLNRGKDFTREIEFGGLESITLSTTEGIISLFQQKDLSMIIAHDKREFRPGIRTRLSQIAGALAGIYAEYEKE